MLVIKATKTLFVQLITNIIFFIFVRKYIPILSFFTVQNSYEAQEGGGLI